MNANRLLAHYDRIADAPDAIARLRRFILDLAVRGKLVPQDPRDEPASELLKRIAEAKERLDRKERSRRELVVSTGDALPYQLPRGWSATSLADLVTILNGRAYKQQELLSAGTPVLRVGNLFTSDRWYYSDLQLAEDKYCDEGDLIFAWSASFGPFIWKGGRVIYHYHIWKLPLHSEADLSKLYLYNFLLHKTREIKEAGHGISMIHMTKEKMELIQVPLPPLAEQHRIVAKVDELMALCDRLEAARAEREKTRDRLSAASLARLNAPDPDPAAFAGHARLALDNLAALTTRPDQIKHLRQTILNLAVRGKLLEGTTAKAAAVGDYRTLQNGYAFKSSWFSKEGVRLLRNANIGHGEIRWNDVVHLPKDRLSEFERFQLNEGEIVLTLDRPFIVTGTKVARVGADDLPSLLLQRVGRFVETSPGLGDDYLYLWINSPHFNEQIDPGRSNGVPHISSKQVEAAEIFVPQLAEQHRIVAKVDALMALCDRLEASLTTGADTRRRLLDALLAEALEPALQREAEAAE
jgi:type I restriction enzyme S subunit